MPELIAVKRRCCSSFSSFGAADRHAGSDARVGDVEDALVGLAVVADEAGAVDADRDRQLLERDVVDDLVEGALEERRVDRDDRLQSGLGHPARHDDRVLLGDADVEDAVGEGFLRPR